MKTHSLAGLDQSDAEMLVSKLTLHAASLRGMVHTAEGKLVTPPTLTKLDLFDSLRALETHCTELETRLNGVATAFEFTALQRGNTAARQTGLGASTSPARSTLLPSDAAANKPTLTKRILAANGVKTLEELREKNSGVPHEELMNRARKLKIVAMIAFFLTLCSFAAVAQTGIPWDSTGNHWFNIGGGTNLCNGGTNNFAANSTNAFNAPGQWYPCNEFTNMGIFVYCHTVSPVVGGTVQLQLTGVDLGPPGQPVSFEGLPFYTLTVPLNSTNLAIATGTVDLTDVDAFTATLVNTNGVALTNVTTGVLFKMIKIGMVPAANTESPTYNPTGNN